MAYCLYAACCSRQGGIAVLDGTEEGTLSLRQMATGRPAHVYGHGRREAADAAAGAGGLRGRQRFDGLPPGKGRLGCGPTGSCVPPEGWRPAIWRPGGRVWCANYGTGSAALLEGETRRLAVFEGQGPHRDRQEAAHIHQVAFTPDGEFLAAVDLGSDSLLLLDAELRLKNRTALPAGSGRVIWRFRRTGASPGASTSWLPP